MLLTKPIREILPSTPRAVVVRIDLAGSAFPYLPGQALLLGSHGHGHRRAYSLADSPEHARRDDCLELLVGLNADGHVGPHLTLEPGSLVDLEGPIGRFTFPEGSTERRFLFIAGGTGIAPLRSMLRHALTVPHDEIGVRYSARLPTEFSYERELRELAERGRIELELRVTRDVASDSWNGTRGRLAESDLAPLVHGRETLCFVCGPPALVQEIPRVLEGLGVPKTRIRTEEGV